MRFVLGLIHNYVAFVVFVIFNVLVVWFGLVNSDMRWVLLGC